MYTISIAYIMENGVIGNRFFELAQVPLFYLAYHKNSINGYGRDNRTFIILTIPFVILSIILTITAYSLDPLNQYISRGVKAGTELGIEYMKRGIGGYELIYFLLILFPVLLYIVFETPHLFKLKFRFVGLLLIVLFAVNILLSNYSIASFLLIFCVLYIAIIPKLNVRLAPLFLIILCVLVIFSTQIFSGFVNSLEILFGNTLNAERLKEVNDFFASNKMGDSFAARISTYENSLNAFYDNPLFGLITQPVVYSGNYLVGFGQHSQILDTFALFGFGIGALQLYIYFQPITIKIRNNNWILSSLALLVLIIFFILILVNNVTPSTGFAVFFIFPTAYDWIQEKLSEYENLS